VEKNAAPLTDWMARMPEAERATFPRDNYFPEGIGLEFARFEDFHKQRKGILQEKLRATLVIASEPQGAPAQDWEALDDMNDEEARASEGATA
jgi:hypothetical protein